jgi:hypothetical protein
MEEAIAATVTSAIDDRIANSRYVGVIVDETTNITVEKMLITCLTLQQNGEPETVFIGNYAIPSGTAECNKRCAFRSWCSDVSGCWVGK